MDYLVMAKGREPQPVRKRSDALALMESLVMEGAEDVKIATPNNEIYTHQEAKFMLGGVT